METRERVAVKQVEMASYKKNRILNKIMGYDTYHLASLKKLTILEYVNSLLTRG